LDFENNFVMNLKLTAILALAVIATSANAQIDADFSNSSVVVENSQTLRVNNLRVSGMGAFNLSFRWDPNTLTFVPLAETLADQGERCESDLLKNAAVSGHGYHFLMRQRTSANFVAGGLTVSSYSLATNPQFTVGWVKTATPQANPYLRNVNLSQFDPNVAYGMMGKVDTTRFQGFETGDVVEVRTQADRAIAVTNARTGAVQTFQSEKGFKVVTTCPASEPNTYAGNVQQEGQNSGAYHRVSRLNGDQFVLEPNYSNKPDELQVAWTQDANGMSQGLVVRGSNDKYPGFFAKSTVAVMDIGGAYSLVPFSPSNKATGAAVFFRK